MMETPRYLFRTTSPGSNGLYVEDMGWYSAAAVNAGFGSERKCLDDLSDEEASEMVQNHVLWRRLDDNLLISFTSSWYFAVQHAIRKKNKCRRSTPENCMVTILDTSFLPADTFQWTPDLLRKYKLTERRHRLLRAEYHEAEYLAEWDVVPPQNAMATATLHSLIAYGLCHAVPNLSVESGELNLALQTFRRKNFTEPCSITPAEIVDAQWLAMCYGRKWVCPMMLWVLSARARCDIEEPLEKEFGPHDGWYDPLPLPLRPDDRSMIPSGVKELIQWHALAEAVHRAQMLTPIAVPAAKDRAFGESATAPGTEDGVMTAEDNVIAAPAGNRGNGKEVNSESATAPSKSPKTHEEAVENVIALLEGTALEE